MLEKRERNEEVHSVLLNNEDGFKLAPHSKRARSQSVSYS